VSHAVEQAFALGNGDGSFETPRSVEVGRGPYFLTLGDFNRDGNLDLVAANFYSDNVAILLGTGDGS
jgi:hypothetical protein